MAARMTSWLAQPGLVRRLISNARLAFRLVREPRVPWLIKLLPLLAVLYVISPLDFVPDLLPFVGQMDDLAIILIAVEGFLKLCPPAATAFHQAAMARGQRYAPMSPADDIIDAEWRRD